MPNYEQHADAGRIIGFATGVSLNIKMQNKRYKRNRKINVNELVIAGIGGSIFGEFTSVLPDIIEPATNPNHRQGFHSLVAVAALLYFMYKTNRGDSSEFQKNAVMAGGIGYLSHLFLDSQTPKGLTFI